MLTVAGILLLVAGLLFTGHAGCRNIGAGDRVPLARVAGVTCAVFGAFAVPYGLRPDAYGLMRSAVCMLLAVQSWAIISTPPPLRHRYGRCTGMTVVLAAIMLCL